MSTTASCLSGKDTSDESNRDFEKNVDEVLKQCKGKSDQNHRLKLNTIQTAVSG